MMTHIFVRDAEPPRAGHPGRDAERALAHAKIAKLATIREEKARSALVPQIRAPDPRPGANDGGAPLSLIVAILAILAIVA